MKELRTFSYLMHPPALRAHGLRQALQQYVDGLARTFGTCDQAEGRPHVRRSSPLALQRSIFRIVQEGLGNAYRHASASAVSVELRHISGRLHVIITDNGRGLDADRRRAARRAWASAFAASRCGSNRLGGRLKTQPPSFWRHQASCRPAPTRPIAEKFAVTFREGVPLERREDVAPFIAPPAQHATDGPRARSPKTPNKQCMMGEVVLQPNPLAQ